MFEVKQSTALDILFFAHDVNGDAVTGIVDGGFTKNISKNAGAFAAMTVTITERAAGWYLLPLSAVHTDTLGVITIYLTSSAKQVNLQFRVAARITDDLATPTNITAGTITTTTNLTNLPAITANWLTAAGTAADFGTEVAAAVWQDAVAGDFTVASSIGKALYIANIVPGAAGGHLIAGSNAGTTTFGALTVTGATTLTGNVALAAGLTVTQSTLNGHGVSITGNGTGHGVLSTSGSGATGDGLRAVAASINGHGITGIKTGTGSDLNATVTPLVLAKTTNITGFNDIAATAVVSAGAITTLSGAVVNVDLVDVLTTYTGDTPQTGDSFARIGVAGAGLTNIDLPNQTMDIVGTITTVTNLTNAATAGDLTATMKTSVKTQVTDGLNVDTYAEPGQAAPPATTTLVGKIGYLYKQFRNRKTQTATQFSLYNDDAVTVDQKSTVSDDGVTAERAEVASGP